MLNPQAVGILHNEKFTATAALCETQEVGIED
jgi:hypothetical protein